MVHKAKLDHDGIYWGVEEVEALAAGDVPVPPDCDLRPGAYRWVPADAKHASARFEPLPAAQVKATPGAPTLEQAFHDFIGATDVTLPPRTAAWRDAFKKTIDERGG